MGRKQDQRRSGAVRRPPAKPPLRVKVVIHEDETGGYWAEVPALPGCVTEGDTRAELLANLRDAVEGCLLSTPGDFQTQAGGQEEKIEL
jgi:predicted RNase H-like HicB family nuclease